MYTDRVFVTTVYGTVFGQSGEELKQVIGTNVVPFTSNEPEYVALAGIGIRPSYRLNVYTLQEWQLNALIKFLAERFRLRPEDMMQRVIKYGLPIRADYVRINVFTPIMWGN